MLIFIISHDDVKYAEILERLPACFDRSDVIRVNFTPESAAIPPFWWEAHPVQWTVVYAHMHAMETASRFNQDALVFEQDAIFAPDFEPRFREFISHLPDKWDQAYIGGQLLATDVKLPSIVAGNPYVLEGYNVHRAHAYITRAASLQKVLEHLREPAWNCYQVIDWRLGYLHMKPDFHVYIPRNDWICGQSAGFSIPENREKPECWWWITPEKAKEEIERHEEFYRNQKTETKTEERGMVHHG